MVSSSDISRSIPQTFHTILHSYNVLHAAVSQEYDTGLDMVWLSERRHEWLNLTGQHVHDMITFTDNHDLPRWLHHNYSSVTRYM